MEWVETTAPTVEVAKDAALDRLGIHESDAEFEVISEGRKGWFGRQKQEARVRARVRPVAPRPKDDRSRKRGTGRRHRSDGARKSSGAGSRAEQPKAAKNSQQTGAKQPGDRRKDKKMNQDSSEISPREISLGEQADLAESFVRELAETMGIALELTRHEMKNDILRIEASGEDIGVLVGHGGGTAQAVDDLVRTVLQRAGGTIREGKIRVDIGGVRARRAEALEGFARRVADEVMETGQDVALEPMDRVDRKIVHDAVAALDEVDSRSEGEGAQRRVVIFPSAE